MATGYKLKRPCPNCPFRTDVPGYLTRGRAIEISEALASGATFSCHKTTEWTDEEIEAGEYENKGSEEFCAGALIMLEHMERPNQIMRIAERTNQYDAEGLDMDAPVHRSTFAFVDHHGDGAEDQEACSVADDGCEAPAGYMIGDTAVPAEPTGDVHECPTCGEPVCGACCNADGICNSCVDDVSAQTN